MSTEREAERVKQHMYEDGCKQICTSFLSEAHGISWAASGNCNFYQLRRTLKGARDVSFEQVYSPITLDATPELQTNMRPGPRSKLLLGRLHRGFWDPS